MKASKFIKDSGPYEVVSISQDGQGVRLEIYPAFPEYNSTGGKDTTQEWLEEPHWALHRYKGGGGGPGIFTAIALAKEFESFLNQGYMPEQVQKWKDTNALALKTVREKAQKRFERHMEKLEKAKR